MGLRSAARSHVIAWRKDMERRGLAPATIRRMLSALSSLFDYLCERSAVTGNPVDGVKRPMANGTGLSAEVRGLCVHSLRATAATNALSHDFDIAKVQEWLGHANVSTTCLYDRRKSKPEDSPTFRVKY